jgi:hypothetical protein
LKLFGSTLKLFDHAMKLFRTAVKLFWSPVKLFNTAVNPFIHSRRPSGAKTLQSGVEKDWKGNRSVKGQRPRVTIMSQ